MIEDPKALLEHHPVKDAFIYGNDLVILHMKENIHAVRNLPIKEEYHFPRIWKIIWNRYLNYHQNFPITKDRTFQAPTSRYSAGAIFFSTDTQADMLTSKKKDTKIDYKLTSKNIYEHNKRLTMLDSNDILFTHLGSSHANEKLIQVPRKMVGLVITRMLIHNYILQNNKQNLSWFLQNADSINPKTPSKYEEVLGNQLFSNNTESPRFDLERQLLIHYLWYVSKCNLGKLRGSDTDYRFDKENDPPMYSPELNDPTQFEYDVMKFPPTWLLNQNQASWNDTLTPTEIQDLMHSLSVKLSDYDYDTSSENVLGLISLIFKVRFNIIYFNKSSKKGHVSIDVLKKLYPLMVIRKCCLRYAYAFVPKE